MMILIRCVLFSLFITCRIKKIWAHNYMAIKPLSDHTIVTVSKIIIKHGSLRYDRKQYIIIFMYNIRNIYIINNLIEQN